MSYDDEFGAGLKGDGVMDSGSGRSVLGRMRAGWLVVSPASNTNLSVDVRARAIRFSGARPGASSKYIEPSSNQSMARRPPILSTPVGRLKSSSITSRPSKASWGTWLSGLRGKPG